MKRSAKHNHNHAPNKTSPNLPAPKGNPSVKKPRHQFICVRVMITAVFGLILVSVGALHLHLIKLESSYNSDGNVRESTTGVNDLVRRRHVQQSNNVKTSSISQLMPMKKELNDNDIPGRGSGSKRGHVTCDTDVDSLVSYWSDPRSDSDLTFKSPFLNPPDTADRALTSPEPARYLSFEPDCGGWNNIRMEFEIMVVLASATGRTLVLPPEYPVYLLRKDNSSIHRSLQDFFQYGGNNTSNNNGFDDIVNVITMEEFFQKEFLEKKSYPLPVDKTNRTRVLASIDSCYYKAKMRKSCEHLFDHLSSVADYVPNWHGEHHCLIMDDINWHKPGKWTVNPSQPQNIRKFCNDRTVVYYNRHLHDAPLIHFRSHLKATRLLVHFYAFIYFTSPKIGNYYKRLIRDRVRYSDPIQCAAGKIVNSLLGEYGSYSSMHVRRGDFQWPKMRISAEEWVANTRHILKENEVVYICTDETNRTFFDPLRERYQLKFLDDYKELAGLDELDPNFVGMIDVVVASRGRQFVGTYFSSFSAFIGRLRGYHGMSGRAMHYGFLKRMNETHQWSDPHSSYSAREYPTGWVGIDGDVEPSERDFF